MVEILCKSSVSSVSKRCKIGKEGFKNVQSKKSKREKSLVDPADHDPGIFFPVRYIAVVLERRAHVPGQQAPADSPDQCKEAINRNVEIRSEADAAVQDDSHSQRRDGEERRRHELRIKISMSSMRAKAQPALAYSMRAKLPVQKSTASASDRASSAT